MRIVFFQWDFGRGGAETVAFNLSNYLCEQGNKVHILTINNKDQLSERLNTEVRFTTFNKKRIMSSLFSLIRFMRTENIDLLDKCLGMIFKNSTYHIPHKIDFEE